MPTLNLGFFKNKGDSLLERRAIAQQLSSESEPEKRKNLMISGLLKPHYQESLKIILDKFKADFEALKCEKQRIISSTQALLECTEMSAIEVLNKFVAYHVKNEMVEFNEKYFGRSIENPEEFCQLACCYLELTEEETTIVNKAWRTQAVFDEPSDDIEDKTRLCCVII